MQLEEFKLSLLIMGWDMEESEYSIHWRKKGKVLQWDKENPIFGEQLVHFEAPSDSPTARNVMVKPGGSLALSYAFSTFKEAIESITDDP